MILAIVIFGAYASIIAAAFWIANSESSKATKALKSSEATMQKLYELREEFRLSQEKKSKAQKFILAQKAPLQLSLVYRESWAKRKKRPIPSPHEDRKELIKSVKKKMKELSQ